MKKIAITTSVSISNYGTKLQALAMCEIFKERGYKPTILEFSETDNFTIFNKAKKALGNIIKRLILGKDYLNLLKCKRVYGNVSVKFQSSIIKRYESIDSADKMIPHFRYIGTKEGLVQYAKKFDIFVTGSDQVWHPFLNKKNLWFFTLNFAPKEGKRIAYAPSLGVDELTEAQARNFSLLLKGMWAISLRESSGVKCIQQLTDKHVSLVLDPTLLIGRNLWDKVISEEKVPTDKNYCLCYLLGSNPQHREICEVLAKKMNIKLLNFAHFKAYNEADELLSGDKLYDVSPTEFIGLIKNAKFVLTDSFHCSVFSMMYHTPFMTLLRFQNNDTLSTNTRIFSMLQQFGLDNRILTDMRNLDTIINSTIDFHKVEGVLASKRRESNLYLNKALRNEKTEI